MLRSVFVCLCVCVFVCLCGFCVLLSGVLLCNCVHGACLCTKGSPNDLKSIKNAHENRHKSAQGCFSSVSGRRLCKSRSRGAKPRSGYRTKVDPLGEKCASKGRFGSPWRPKMTPKSDLPRLYGHFGVKKRSFGGFWKSINKSIKFWSEKVSFWRT